MLAEKLDISIEIKMCSYAKVAVLKHLCHNSKYHQETLYYRDS